ncbi:MAG TPA: oxidoreductase [Dongiaceae bacterium]|nr:oxidoreductase [Dongiaceae bacterium]
MIDVGLIGFGLGGKAFHAPVITAVDGLRLAAVLQRHENTAAETYPGVKIVRSVEELLAIPSIRLIAISTPNDTHYAYVKACLEAGRDVVVDKPFTTTFAEAKELAELARKRGRLLTVYQERRLDGDFLTLKKLIAEGALGRLVHYESTFDRCRAVVRDSWKEKPGAGCGVFFDLAPHLIDDALVLFGPPESLLADIRNERDRAINSDAFDLTFYYPQRFRATISANTLAPVPRAHFSVRGTRAEFIKHNLDPQEALLRAGQKMEGESWGLEKEADYGTLYEIDDARVTPRKIPTMRGDYRAYYANVRDVLLGRAKPDVTLEDALRVMYALELAEQSSAARQILPWKLSL